MREAVAGWEIRVEAMTKVPLFSQVGRRDLERLAVIATEQTFKAGEEIVTQGEAGDSMFILTSGEAEVVDGGAHLADLGVGDFLGEMALFRQTPRSATVRAKTEVAALRVTQWDLEAELRGIPSIAVQMLGVLSDRLHAANQELARATGTPSTVVD
jgi:CRP-like cAMP-binding protein